MELDIAFRFRMFACFVILIVGTRCISACIRNREQSKPVERNMEQVRARNQNNLR